MKGNTSGFTKKQIRAIAAGVVNSQAEKNMKQLSGTLRLNRPEQPISSTPMQSAQVQGSINEIPVLGFQSISTGDSSNNRNGNEIGIYKVLATLDIQQSNGDSETHPIKYCLFVYNGQPSAANMTAIFDDNLTTGWSLTTMFRSDIGNDSSEEGSYRILKMGQVTTSSLVRRVSFQIGHKFKTPHEVQFHGNAEGQVSKKGLHLVCWSSNAPGPAGAPIIRFSMRTIFRP
jgi:hypothetical protein